MCSYPHPSITSIPPSPHPPPPILLTFSSPQAEALDSANSTSPLFPLQFGFQPVVLSSRERERTQQNPWEAFPLYPGLPCPRLLLENSAVDAFFTALFLFSLVCFDFFLFPNIILMCALVSLAWATLKTPLLPSVSLSALCPFQRCPCALSRTS